jgi:beta-lactam-binding protein with PASTA domain
VRGRPILNFLQGASLVLVLVAVALLAAVATMHFAIHGAEVQVPALKGMTVADARSQTAGLGLLLDVDNRYYSAEVAAGHILTQSPTPGTVVRREWKVRVAESLGPQTVNVPDTVGKEQRVAELELRRAGLSVGLIAQLPFAAAAEGTVLAQDPPGKAQGIDQPSINLLVAAPQEEAADGYLMPDLTGMMAVSALGELSKVGIKAAPLKTVEVPIPSIGSSGAPPKPPTRPNSVVSQQPPAGVRVDQSTVVKLVVGR